MLASLETIKDNQYLVYTEINKANAQLSTLDMTMKKAVNSLEDIKNNTDDIKESVEIIAYNSERTAYYTKKNAELTDALGFLIALK